MMSRPVESKPLGDEHKGEILRRFVQAVVRQDLSPEGTARSLLIDQVPLFLDELGAELAQQDGVRDGQDAFDTSPTARRHGDQRWNLGYDLEALIREYGVLRHCILTTVRDFGGDFTMDEFDTLAKCLNVGVAEAAAAYVLHRDAQVQRERDNLALLAEAGQALTASLDHRSTLLELTRLMVPRLADACVIRLEGSNGLELVSSAELGPEKEQALLDLHLCLPSLDRQAGYPALGPEKPQLIPRVSDEMLAACARSADHLAQLRSVNVRSWMAVPLKIQGQISGSILLAYSESAREYSASDLLLVEDLARRAAVAIENARLYAASQTERARVEEATRAKDEFVAMISHELRTPLNAVLGWTRMLRSGYLSESKRAHALEVIERNTIAQNQLIDDLLDISRIITGNMRIQFSEVDVGRVVELAAESIRPAADAKHITLELDLERSAAPIRADAERLRQVVSNLLTNALKFTPKGGRISVRMRRSESEIEITVEDTGAGITRDFLPHVFEHFRQSQAGTTRTQGGLGIGLAIVKHLVELHGGVVAADSPGPGRGATFVVRLPKEFSMPASELKRLPPRARDTAVLGAQSGLNGLRLLVVDDEPDTLELLATVFEACGVHVVTARNVPEALARIDGEELDVIISDIGMPGDDGYTLIRNVRRLASESKRNLPALALTAYSRAEDRARALGAGFNAYTTKPVEPAALIALVADLAGRTPTG
jgi:signal transduction histidine kinase/ActR/RegA family two-component response regulator